MTSSIEPIVDVTATAVEVNDETITVELSDGRTIIVPTAWLPRLVHATPEERAHYNILHDGIEWPDVEADASIRGLLLGHKSGENPESLKFWLENRKQGKRVTVMDWLASRKQSKTRTN